MDVKIKDANMEDLWGGDPTLDVRAKKDKPRFCLYAGNKQYIALNDTDERYTLVTGMQYAEIFESMSEAERINHTVNANATVVEFFNRKKDYCNA